MKQKNRSLVFFYLHRTRKGENEKEIERKTRKWAGRGRGKGQVVEEEEEETLEKPWKGESTLVCVSRPNQMGVLLHTPHCIVVNCCLPRHKAIQKTTNYLKWLVKLFPEAVEPKRLSFIKWEKDCRKLEDRAVVGARWKVVGDFLETFCVLFLLLLFFFVSVLYLRRESEGFFALVFFILDFYIGLNKILHNYLGYLCDWIEDKRYFFFPLFIILRFIRFNKLVVANLYSRIFVFSFVSIENFLNILHECCFYLYLYLFNCMIFYLFLHLF